MSVNKNEGAVSLFVVIFSAVIISILSISYARITISDQQQSSSSDLSRSAYDSALAGIEDAKRAISKYEDICRSKTSAECLTALESIDSSIPTGPGCNGSVDGLDGVTVETNSGEVKVSDFLNQAYTCIKINMKTPDYLGLLVNNESDVIPINSESGVRSIRIDWFSPKDLTPGATSASVPNIATVDSAILDSNWPANRPPIVRAQLVSFDSSGFNLSELDNNSSSSTYSKTVFMYPSLNGSANASINLSSDTRQISNPSGDSRLNIVRCVNNMSTGYSCSVTLTLPSVKDSDDTAYLRLSSIYAKANYRVVLLDGSGNVVMFNGVQPEIDSTGRADNLFRRVKARVSVSNVNFPYPEAAVDISGSLCKSFWVTDNASGDLSSGTCLTN